MLITSLILSIHFSAWENLTPTWRIFDKCPIWGF